MYMHVSYLALLTCTRSSFFIFSKYFAKKKWYNLPWVYLQMGIMQYQLLSILCMLITTKWCIFTTCVSFPPQQKDGNKYYYSYYSKRNPCKRRWTCTIMTRLYIKTNSLTIDSSYFPWSSYRPSSLHSHLNGERNSNALRENCVWSFYWNFSM